MGIFFRDVQHWALVLEPFVQFDKITDLILNNS